MGVVAGPTLVWFFPLPVLRGDPDGVWLSMAGVPCHVVAVRTNPSLVYKPVGHQWNLICATPISSASESAKALETWHPSERSGVYITNLKPKL